MLFQSIHHTLEELIVLLEQLNETQYTESWHELGNATIGKHVRHIIELFQCLENQYESGIVDYNTRERNVNIETNILFASTCIRNIQNNINRPDKPLLLLALVSPEDRMSIKSNYFRELAYNLEHCIHHQALIKVALLKLENIQYAETFGIAPSTIQYQSEINQ